MSIGNMDILSLNSTSAIFSINE